MVKIPRRLTSEMLYRARTVFEVNTQTGRDRNGCLSEPLTLKLLSENAEEHERCSDCEALFDPGSVPEDKCPECGEEGTMCAGLMIYLWGDARWVNFP